MGLGRRVVAVALFFMCGVTGVAVPNTEVAAGSGLTQWRWGDAGLTISSTSYRYSNMSGFWQAVVNSNGCSLSVDGNFGNNTLWYSAVFQNNIIGYNNGGVMTPTMLNLAFNANSVYGRRLVYLYTDGYATERFGYYGGFTGSDATHLGWNVFAAQWYFSQYPYTNPGSVIPATPNRTIGSVAACS